jgi:hypothetical protein
MHVGMFINENVWKVHLNILKDEKFKNSIIFLFLDQTHNEFEVQ